MTILSFTKGYGKHSVRYLGPILWSKIDKNSENLKRKINLKERSRMLTLLLLLLILLLVLLLLVVVVVVVVSWCKS